MRPDEFDRIIVLAELSLNACAFIRAYITDIQQSEKVCIALVKPVAT